MVSDYLGRCTPNRTEKDIDGKGTDALVKTPFGVFVDHRQRNRLLVTSGLFTIRSIDVDTGVITTVFSSGFINSLIGLPCWDTADPESILIPIGSHIVRFHLRKRIISPVTHDAEKLAEDQASRSSDFHFNSIVSLYKDVYIASDVKGDYLYLLDLAEDRIIPLNITDNQTDGLTNCPHNCTQLTLAFINNVLYIGSWQNIAMIKGRCYQGTNTLL